MTARRRPPLPSGRVVAAVPLPPDADALWQVLDDCTPTEGGLILTREDRQRLTAAAIKQFGGERRAVETMIAAHLAPFLIGKPVARAARRVAAIAARDAGGTVHRAARTVTPTRSRAGTLVQSIARHD